MWHCVSSTAVQFVPQASLSAVQVQIFLNFFFLPLLLYPPKMLHARCAVRLVWCHCLASSTNHTEYSDNSVNTRKNLTLRLVSCLFSIVFLESHTSPLLCTVLTGIVIGEKTKDFVSHFDLCIVQNFPVQV